MHNMICVIDLLYYKYCMKDSQYQDLPYKLNERSHDYGKHVHLLSDPYLITKLARLCHPDCVQP